jgi:hypothetical protein
VVKYVEGAMVKTLLGAAALMTVEVVAMMTLPKELVIMLTGVVATAFLVAAIFVKAGEVG